MLQHEILIRKGAGAVDGNGASAVAVEEVSALDHEILDHAVEPGALVALRSALGVFRLAGAELAEVFGRLGGDVCEEFHLDAAERFSCGSGFFRRSCCASEGGFGVFLCTFGILQS